MAEPDYVGWALGTAANNRASTQAANDQFSLFAKRMAAQRVAQDDYAGAATALAGSGDVPATQALQQGAARQDMLSAESAGNLTDARAAAARTGVQADYDTGSQGAMQAAMQKVAALEWATDHISAIPAQPGDAQGDPSTPRAQAFRRLIGTGMLQAIGASPDGLNKIAGGPLDDATLASYRARLPFTGVLKGEGGVETAYSGGNVVGQGYTAPVKLDSGPGTSQELVPASGGPPIASSTPAPQVGSPGQAQFGQGGVPGPQVPFEPKAITHAASDSVDTFNPNNPAAPLNGGSPNLYPNGEPSRSPASVAMQQPTGAAGTARAGIEAVNNPFNLHSPAGGGTWQGQSGAPNPNGTVNFASPQAADRAEGMVLGHYAALGINTPQAFVARYAPTSPPAEQAAYVRALTQAVGPQFDLRDPATQAAVKAAVIRQEGNAGGGAPAQGVTSIQGRGYQPATMYGVKGIRAPNGDFTPTAGANVDFTAAAGGREKIYNNDEVKQAMASQAAYGALTANAGKMTGPSAYNILDTWIRTINPGRAATVGAIQAAGEQLGMTTEAIGHLQAALQKGALPLNIQQQIIDGVLPFAQGHYDQAARVVKGYTDAARSYGGDQAANAVNVDLGQRPTRYVIRQGGQGGGQPQGSPVQLSADRVAARQQYASLPSGAQYRAPDGSIRVKR